MPCSSSDTIWCKETSFPWYHQTLRARSLDISKSAWRIAAIQSTWTESFMWWKFWSATKVKSVRSANKEFLFNDPIWKEKYCLNRRCPNTRSCRIEIKRLSQQVRAFLFQLSSKALTTILGLWSETQPAVTTCRYSIAHGDHCSCCVAIFLPY